ncbi:MAG: hypothetical protein ACXWG1_17360 [Usitatibacter sp.]
MTYTITRRVNATVGLFTAIACAIPKDHGCIAVVRAHDCDSWDGAISVLDAMAQALEVELSARGDVVLAVEAR